MSKYTPKKIDKSLLYYMICGGAVLLLILTMFLIYAWIMKIDILAWFTSKTAYLVYGAIAIYLTIGIIMFINGKIKRM